MADEPKRRGPKLIGEQKRKRYNVTLDPDLKEEVEKVAKAEGMSFSMWLEVAARERIERTKRKRM